jgi:hypothetical protein
MPDRIASERIYLTADKSEIVTAGDPRAAFLLAGEGCAIPADFIADVPAQFLAGPDPEVEVEPEPEKPEPAAKTPKQRASRGAADTATEAPTEE